MEVEAYYIDQGYLFPAFHESYWIGLTSNASAWPKFSWVDGTPTLHSKGFENWGIYMPGSNPEPNNFPQPPEYCAVANASQPMIGSWGWADTNCDGTDAAFMCELLPRGPYYTFTSDVTNNTYILNTAPAKFTDAEDFCTDQGGHLVSYGSMAEQVGRGARPYVGPVAHASTTSSLVARLCMQGRMLKTAHAILTSRLNACRSRWRSTLSAAGCWCPTST